MNFMFSEIKYESRLQYPIGDIGYLYGTEPTLGLGLGVLQKCFLFLKLHQ